MREVGSSGGPVCFGGPGVHVHPMWPKSKSIVVSDCVLFVIS